MTVTVSYSRDTLHPEFRSNSFAFGPQLLPDLVGTPDGRFVSAYDSELGPTAPEDRHGKHWTMKRTTFLTIFAASVALGLQAMPSRAQSPQTYVLAGGSNASATCSRTAPCGTFANALTKTSAAEKYR